VRRPVAAIISSRRIMSTSMRIFSISPTPRDFSSASARWHYGQFPVLYIRTGFNTPLQSSDHQHRTIKH
jgi:hypothetical protein